mgnify:CR=1 FL=1
MTIESEIAQAPATEAQELDPRQAVAPPVDIYENADEYLIVADVPGVAQEAVHVALDKDQLSLTADRDDLRFRRVFRIPQAVDRSAIVAELKRGVLNLHLPKSDADKPRRIQIRAG